jgi:superfamily II DNA or RNA helicase
MVTLRDYQAKAVNDIRTAYQYGRRAPLFVLPTGGGKTVLFTYIAQNAAERGKRVLILVHRVELLRQTSKALRGFGVRHGLINPQYTPEYTAPVQVASVQTIINRIGKMPFTPDLIIIDEAHHATASTWRKVINAYPKARLLGVTATPVRSDGTGLGIDAGGMFDTLIEGPSTRALMDMGYLVEPTIYAPKDRLDLSGVRTKMGDYDKKQLGELMDKPRITGDAVAHYKRRCPCRACGLRV